MSAKRILPPRKAATAHSLAALNTAGAAPPAIPAATPSRSAGKRGGAAPAVYNAANEQAVALFLDGRMRFGGIPKAIESALATLGDLPGESRDELLDADSATRRHVMELI
jgi:1-deoxy-D-xylulose-5-phosphate reductoisomerase